MTSSIGMLTELARVGRRCDVWHIHQYGWIAAVAICAGKAIGTPVVLKLTNTGEYGICRSLRQGRLSRVLERIHRWVDCVAPISRETLEEARSFGIPPDRIAPLPNGVETATFRPRTPDDRSRVRAKLGLGDSNVAISLGRLDQQKRLEVLLEAWALALPRLSTRWLLVIVGDGEVRSELERRIESLGISDAARLVGSQANPDEWLAAGDLFLQSSDSEGLSNTMLEAMATGLPVVVTAVSGAQECVYETQSGTVVPKGDPVSMANAIVNMANDPERRQRCGLRGRQAVESAYSIQSVASRAEQVYQSLVVAR